MSRKYVDAELLEERLRDICKNTCQYAEKGVRPNVMCQQCWLDDIYRSIDELAVEKAERKTMRERFTMLRDTPLPKDQQRDGIKTYGDAWAYSMSELVCEGKAGAVEAMKLMLAQIGEDTAEKKVDAKEPTKEPDE